ncbi:MAG: glycosyltransferase family 2 protein [Gemmatimonadota bacterium]
MQRIAALLTCHNRREATLACLHSLKAARGGLPGLSLEVFLTDDGSTDGTAEAVRAFDPNIHIIPGSGHLYWTRGMVAAWRAALDSGRSFDAFLLLNDDTVLDLNALEVLLRTGRGLDPDAIVVGALCDPETGEPTYGGVVRTSRWHPGRTRLVPIEAQTQDVDTFNANCALVPAPCVERIGILDPLFTHAMGDYDYGLRAREAGIPVVVAAGTIGTCPRNDVGGTWLDPRLPLSRRVALLNSPHGLPRREWGEYLRRHGAPFPGLLAMAPLLSVLLSWLKGSQA